MIERILELMKNRNISANKLIIELGLSNSIISDWKRGKSKPSTKAVIKLADYFGVSTDYLLKGVRAPGLQPNDQQLLDKYHAAETGIQESVRKLLDL